MNTSEVLEELKSLGNPSIKKVLVNHGAREPFYGVKVEHLKQIEKRIKVDHALALELYDSGISDAMYLAGLIADDRKMTRDDLQRWVEHAYWSLLSESTVPWVAAGSDIGFEVALDWIESDTDTIACAGWRTLSSITGIKPDAQLDIEQLRDLLNRVRDTIHEQPNRVRYSMNGFVIAVGTNVKALTAYAVECAEKIGTVSVMMGETACKVPYAPEYIGTAVARGTVGKKRKSAKC